jgi:AraC-like DNA-binding protein
MRPSTIEQRRRLYLLARVVIARHYRQALTLDEVARALSSSPRQLTRAYAQFGEVTFREDLLTRRLSIAAQLLIEQPAIPVRDVARLVGFRQAPHFAKAFRRRYGLSPAGFRAEGRAYARGARARQATERTPAEGVCAERARTEDSVLA